MTTPYKTHPLKNTINYEFFSIPTPDYIIDILPVNGNNETKEIMKMAMILQDLYLDSITFSKIYYIHTSKDKCHYTFKYTFN